jgi:hypothetical protein
MLKSLHRMGLKPCPSPEVEFGLKENRRSWAGLGIRHKVLQNRTGFMIEV